jgi:O-6-methylguanine DNA methyltransferase
MLTQRHKNTAVAESCTLKIPGLPTPFDEAMWNIAFSERGLCELSLAAVHKSIRPTAKVETCSPRVKELVRLLRQRLSGKRVDIPFKEFDLNGHPQFHVRIFKAMHAIPYGDVRTYGEAAEAAGSPLAFRACGQACRNNSIFIFIPCHRVVAASGLGGFACGLRWKEALLKIEGVKV